MKAESWAARPAVDNVVAVDLDFVGADNFAEADPDWVEVDNSVVADLDSALAVVDSFVEAAPDWSVDDNFVEVEPIVVELAAADCSPSIGGTASSESFEVADFADRAPIADLAPEPAPLAAPLRQSSSHSELRTSASDAA